MVKIPHHKMAEFEQWVTAQDGLDKLRLIKTSLPKPGPNEVLVKVHSVALNYRDIEGMSVISPLILHE